MRIRITLQCWAGTEFWRIDSIKVTCSDLPNVDAGMDVTVCEGDDVTLTATNPDGATIGWSGGITDGVSFTPGLGSTTYTVTATDPIGGCVSTDDVDVIVLPALTAFIDPAGPYTTASGSELLNGTPAGGAWSATCGPCIDGASGEFDPSVAGPGTHTICYTVGSPPCEDTYCIDIEVTGGGGGPCDGDVTFSDPTCFGFNDGSVTIDMTGGTSPYTFVITNEAGDTVNIGNTNTANTLPEGWYYFEVIDDDGCVHTASVFIDDPEPLEVDIDLTFPLCNGDETGIAVVDTVLNWQGTYGGITYIWNPDPSSVSGVGGTTSTDMGAGTYTLTLTDEFGCSLVEEFEIIEPDELIFTELGYDPAYCRLFSYQSGNGVVYAAAGGGTPTYIYEWKGPLGSSELDSTDNTTWGGLNPGDYEVTVVDDNGCVLTQVITVDSLNPIAAFDVVSAELNAACEGTAVVDAIFHNNSSNYANPNNPSADTTFWWNLNHPQSSWYQSKDVNESMDTTYALGGEYEVCLVAQNKNGCTDTTCKIITVFDPLEFVPVNVFTPNGDGVNDLFDFSNTAKSIAEFNCTVFDRWGIEIYQFIDINDSWDGNTMKGRPCTDGVYFYIYSGEAENGDEFSGQGTIQLLRNP